MKLKIFILLLTLVAISCKNNLKENSKSKATATNTFKNEASGKQLNGPGWKDENQPMNKMTPNGLPVVNKVEAVDKNPLSSGFDKHNPYVDNDLNKVSKKFYGEEAQSTNDGSSMTVFNKNTEVEEVEEGVVLKGDPKQYPDRYANHPNYQENPPRPLSKLKDVGPGNLVNLATLPKNNAVTGVSRIDEALTRRPPKVIQYEPVTYERELSPAGKAALELAESGDFEYQKLLNSGFESPKTISNIIKPTPTRVDRAAVQEYFWHPTDPRNTDIWKNPEFNRWNNRLLDTRRYFTPARFHHSETGQVMVEAPSNSALSITTPTMSQYQSGPSFLEEEVDESDVDDVDTDNADDHPSYYEDIE